MTKPNEIPFTQYLRPDGRPRPVWIERSPEIATLAQKLITKGHCFEIEELQDRTVSMTVEAIDRDEPPIAIELCLNGPEVPATVDRLVLTAWNLVKPEAVAG